MLTAFGSAACTDGVTGPGTTGVGGDDASPDAEAPDVGVSGDTGPVEVDAAEAPHWTPCRRRWTTRGCLRRMRAGRRRGWAPGPVPDAVVAPTPDAVVRLPADAAGEPLDAVVSPTPDA